MKATLPHQRTAAILSELREVIRSLGVTAESLRDTLNQDYLHSSDKVTVPTVAKWLRVAQGPSIISSESLLAITEYIEDKKAQ